MVYYRAYKTKAASRQLDAAKNKPHVTGYDTESLHLTFTWVGLRLLAAAGARYATNVFFYRNNLFQNERGYHGVAIHPKHLSLWERLRGVGSNHDPKKDFEQKIEEMRGDWEEWQARKAMEKEKGEWSLEDDTESSDDVTA